MFFIWGWSTKNIGEFDIEGECPACKESSLTLVGMQTIFDIFWIPTIPLDKSACILCKSCGASYAYEEKGKNASSKLFKTPKWSFSGLIAIMLFLITFIGLAVHGSRKINNYITTPVEQSYFIFKNAEINSQETPYSFGKIEKVNEETLKLRFSGVMYSHQNMARKEAGKLKRTDEKDLSPIYEITKDQFKDIGIDDVVR